MKKKWNVLIALVLALCMLSGCAGTAAKKETSTSETTKKETSTSETTKTEVVETSSYPEYLNLDSARPIVKEGEEVTLKVLLRRDQIANSDIEEQWSVKFIEEKLNIKLEIEEVTNENVGERKNLLLASNDLPDLMFGMNFTKEEIVKYGVEGGVLLPMSDYFSDELTPNILAKLDEFPNVESQITANDGKIYDLPYIQSSQDGYGGTIGTQKTFLDTEYMEAIGLEKAPETLDEFVEMLRAYKELDPSVMGVDKIYPIVNVDTLIERYFMNAFGWIGDVDYYVAPCWDLETQQVVVPAMQEKFADYIKFMHMLYQEGLIHEDFFTIDNTASQALMAEGRAAVVADYAPYLAQPDRFSNFIAATPLSSQWSEKAAVTQGVSCNTGRNFISADTEYPEVCMRLFDYLYSDEGATYIYCGPPAGSEDTLGMVEGFTLDENNNIVIQDVVSGKYDSLYDYRVNKIILGMQNPTDVGAATLYAQKLCGIAEPAFPELDLNDPDCHYRYICYEAHKGKIEPALPPIYASEKDSEKYLDLYTVLRDYVSAEVAKFVVGQRPIEEVSELAEELKTMKSEEYLQLCQGFYSNYTR